MPIYPRSRRIPKQKGHPVSRRHLLDARLTRKYLALGASLYVPAIHPDGIHLAQGLKYPNLKSLVLDTEDAIAEDDLPYAYHAIERLLHALEADEQQRPLLFIRVRDPAALAQLNQFDHLDKLDGFVLPKFTKDNMADYAQHFIADKYYMPILETAVFSVEQITAIRDYLLPKRPQILAVRIGATDLLSCFNLRRDCHTLIYDIGIVKHVITHCVMLFGEAGFNITAPVFECFGETHRRLLQQEVRLDLLNGLFGKTIIHPWQIDVVQDLYRVSQADYEVAEKLLDEYSPAVFKRHAQMHEKATHSGWAQQIMQRAWIYGID